MPMSANTFIRSVYYLLFLSIATQSQLLPEDDPSIDYFCGISWKEANTYCSLPCPSGSDADCPPNEYGRPRQCYASSGCAARTERLDWYGIISLDFDRVEHWKATNGELMSGDDSDVFRGSMMELITKNLQNEMEIDCVEILEQEYDRPCVGAVIPGRELQYNFTDDYYCGVSWFEAGQSCTSPCPSKLDSECLDDSGENRSCFAATGCVNQPKSTHLDLEVKICSVYIPTIGQMLYTPMDLENDVMGVISKKEQQIVNTIGSSSTFFKALTGVSAISSDMVAETPSNMPSEAPTRPGEVTIETYIDARPSGSYGIFFSVRTHANVSTVLLTGMNFLTPHNGLLEYEVYSRLGEFQQYEGYPNEWDLIAKGSTTGLGPDTFTRVLDEDPDDDSSDYLGFTPIHVPGNGGMRSFYYTMTDKYTTGNNIPVPISFSSSLSDENEGTMNYGVVTSNEELEIMEGDGVLDFPAPINRDFISDIFYRRPRGFLGSFDYIRQPCYPNLNFYGWPCPYVPKKRDPTRNPTKKPVTLPTGTVALSDQKPTPRPSNQKTKTPVKEVEFPDRNNTQSNATLGDSQAPSDANKQQNDANGAALLVLKQNVFFSFTTLLLILNGLG